MTDHRPTRFEQLETLIQLKLKANASDDDYHEYHYQSELKKFRPNAEDIDYIAREVSFREAKSKNAVLPDSFSKEVRYLPSGSIREAFAATPMALIYRWIHRVGGEWALDTRNPMKAYVMACLSEIAYLHLEDYEVAERDRYKIVPASTLTSLLYTGWRINLLQVVPIVGDIPVQILAIRRFVYIIYRTSYFVAVSVRGTAAATDWLINLNALKRDGYHRGFYDEALAAMPVLREAVDRFSEEGMLLYFTGHSLGAGVAGALAQNWMGSQRVMTPYLYASPRYASRHVKCSAPPYGHVAPNDLVPHLPPRFLGFADAGTPPEIVPSGEQWMSGLRTLLHWLSLGRDCTKPHAMELYRYNVGTALAERFAPDVYVQALTQMVVSGAAMGMSEAR